MPSQLSTASQLDAIIEKYTEDPYTQMPRAVVMVANKDGVIYEGARGPEQVPLDPSSGEQVKNDTTTSTIFELWSCTKLVTTIAVMQLIENGTLEEDDDISKWLPEINDVKVFGGYKDGQPVLEPLNAPVTVKMLLTHTTGSALDFGDEVSPDFHKYMSEVLGQKELLSVYAGGDPELIKKIPFVHQPGARWTYGYSLDWAAMLIEKITGASIEDYFVKNIFTPLGIDDMSFKPHPQKVNWCMELPDGKYHYLPAMTLSQKGVWGGAGLRGSPKSYIKIVQALIRGGELGGKRILKQETVDLMFKQQVTDEQMVSGDMTINFLQKNYNDALGQKEPFKWRHGYGGVRSVETAPTGRTSTTMTWTGACSTYWFADPQSDLAFIAFVNMFPVYSIQGAKFIAEVERAVYSGIAKK